MSLFELVTWTHVIAGTIGLITGLIGMISAKGKKLHRSSGKIFFFAMLMVFISSVYMSIVKNNIFLLLIGFFSIYLTSTGYRILSLKQLSVKPIKPKPVDYLLGIVGILAGCSMYCLSVLYFSKGSMFGIVLLLFGTVALSLGYIDLKMFKKPPSKKTFWLSSHALRMGGAFTATVTAFTVVNIQIQQQWILWILPSIIIIPLTRQMLKRFLSPIK